MHTRYYKRTLLCACGLLALLIIAVFWLSWREIQQWKLNMSLIAAIKRADAKTTIELLNRGADPNASDATRSSPSLWRLIWERMRGAATKIEAGTPALLLAVNSPCENPDIDKTGYQRSVLIVKALLDHGADIRSRDKNGFDVLYDGEQCAYDNELLRLLIRYHAPVNLHSPASGRTPLMNAAGWGDPEAINLLLDAGANIDDQDKEGSTALMYAVRRANDDNAAALVARYADMSLKDKTGASPLSVAQSGLASNITTPNNHGDEHKTWSNIVRLLTKARKQAEPDRRLH